MDVRFRLAVFCVAALIVAGCSGAAMNVPASAVGSQAKRAHGDGKNSIVLLEPLAFDGANFSPLRVHKCEKVSLADAPAFVASGSGALSMNPATLSPVCLPGSNPNAMRPNDGWGDGPKTLYIVAFPAGSSDLSAAVGVEGPIDVRDDPWAFAPSSPGLTTQAGSSYVFFVARMNAPPAPVPTPDPATFQLVAPVKWSHGSFSNVAVSDCSSVTTSSAPSFQATAGGPFAVSGNSITLAPNCAPGSTEELYLIAVQTAPVDGTCETSKARRSTSSLAPNASQIVDGWVIAGPMSSDASPWVFDASTNEFVTQACATYAFFVGTLAGGK